MSTALITGASRGIGCAVAKALSKKGFNVAINYQNSREKAESLKKEILDMGKKAEIFCADVSKPDEAERMIKDVVSVFGDIDVLVNNAGRALPQGLFTDFNEKKVREIFDVNVFGMMNCSRAVIPHFVQKKSGVIVNMSSVWGISGGSCEVIYSASKGAVISFTKALSRELAPSGIRVNAVAPGMIDTDMNSHLSKEDVDAFLEEIPMGRIGTPEEVADVVCFLASSDARYITGQIIAVDGGIA